MALFYYQAFLKDGKKVSGYIDAGSEVAVKEQLQKKGMFPTQIVRAVGGAQKNWFWRLFEPRITTKELILFTKQLAVLLKAGVPLLQAFELLSEQFTGKLKNIIVTIKDDLKEGRSLADALSDFPNIFDTIYVQLVRAGEASGKLEVVLSKLDAFLERQEEIRRRVKSATMMPMIQAAVGVVVVGVMMIMVVPKLTANFASRKKVLPLPTRIVLAVSTFMRAYWLPMLIVLTLIVLAFAYWRSTPSGKLRIDQLKLKLPLIKYFTKTNAVVQFSSTLGTLIESGVNLAESLDIVVKIIDNKVLSNTLNAARDNIIKQGKIAQYLKQTDIFPPIAIYLIKTGEESGALDTMLLTVAKKYEEDLTEITDSLTAKLGPLLLICMAAVVGFIMVAVLLPMLDFGDIAKR
jgi:type II secretory pathway component PulF